MTFPACAHLALDLRGSAFYVHFNRPDARNAMNAEMVRELCAVAAHVAARRDIRVVVLRGTGGHFCAGGDVREMLTMAQGTEEQLASYNRAFGQLLEAIDELPQIVIAACEGSVLGGGFGLACAADITLAVAQTEFGLPEVSLGIVPAQIAPFLVRRLGFSHAQRLAISAARIGVDEARALGLVHARFETSADLEQGVASLVADLLRSAPGAVSTTKAIFRAALVAPLPGVLDQAARSFAEALLGAEGREGVRAFGEKRAPAWYKE